MYVCILGVDYLTGIFDVTFGFCWKVEDIDVLWTGVIVISLRDC